MRPPTSTEELVRAAAEDGVVQGGVLDRPARGHAKAVAVLWVWW